MWLKALGVAGLVALVVLAYPIYFQFFGPGSYRGIEELIYALRLDPTGYLTAGGNTLGDFSAVSQYGRQICCEDSGSLGLSLVLGFVLLSILLWRDARVRAAVITAGLFAMLSFGPALTVFNWNLGIPGPQALLAHLPLFDAALPARYGKVVTPLVAFVLAIGLDRLRQLRLHGEQASWRAHVLPVGLAAIMLLPLLPLPLRVEKVPPAPPFVTAESWRPLVGPGQSVLWLPTPAPGNPTPLLWSSQHGLEPRMSHGYFHGPDHDGRAHFGAAPRPSDALFASVLETGRVRAVTDADRRQLLADLTYWQTAIIVVWPESQRAAEFKLLVDQLVGEGQLTGGVWVWDVRALRSAV
jgi:hypothetical protein